MFPHFAAQCMGAIPSTNLLTCIHQHTIILLTDKILELLSISHHIYSTITSTYKRHTFVPIASIYSKRYNAIKHGSIDKETNLIGVAGQVLSDVCVIFKLNSIPYKIRTRTLQQLANLCQQFRVITIFIIQVCEIVLVQTKNQTDANAFNRFTYQIVHNPFSTQYKKDCIDTTFDSLSLQHYRCHLCLSLFQSD